MTRPEEYFKLNTRSKWMLGIAFFAISISFFAPLVFTQYSVVDFTETGNIGDTISGTMSPFIGIAGILLTYLAFYMQFKANKLQREQFEIQLDEDKSQFKLEMSEQKEQFRKSQFENQFYEMVRLHKENVNEITLTFTNPYFTGSQQVINESSITGRETFKYMLEEVKTIYFVARKAYRFDTKPDKLISKAYSAFFHGLGRDEKIENPKPSETEYAQFVNLLIDINREHVQREFKHLKSNIASRTDYKKAVNLGYKLAEGHSSYLAHYYRHLYQTVKFVANQSEDFISYEEKRKYLRILRAQLSNQEQAMLFYNWKSEFGNTWENTENHFFTDYRMIHNLYNDLIIHEFSLINIFNLILEPTYRKEKDREDDHLFEFQDW